MANVIEIIIQGEDRASSVLTGVTGALNDIGGSISRLGVGITAATAPLAAGLGVAINQAVIFDESMTNVGAVLGLNRQEMEGLNAEVLALGAASRAGPQEAALAFSDIVGGVADASTHMAILQQSIATAEAGASDLGGTTSALISVMNSYGFSAEQASFASDVLTRTVQAGVGSMDEFASALPSVTGLANSLGISFDQLGAQAAYLTTQGFTASEAATQLRSIMASLLNPNTAMVEALQELGFASGEAAVEQLGLVGAMQAIQGTAAVTENGLAATVGSVEALNGVIALSSETATQALSDFSDGLSGATAAAQALQLESPAAQMGLLNSQIQGIGIAIGQNFLPAINLVIAQIRPMLDRVFEWMRANPQLTGTIAGMAAALVTLGPALMGIGAAITLMLSPMGAIAALIGLVGAAFATNFGGINDLVAPFVENAVAGFERLFMSLSWFVDDIGQYGIVDAIMAAFGIGGDSNESWVEGVLFSFGMARDTAESVVQTIAGVLSTFSNAWNMASLGFSSFTDILGESGDYVTAIVESISAAVGNFAIALGAPVPVVYGLQTAFENGFGAIYGFITDTLIPGFFSLINTISDLWTLSQPYLAQFADWFMTSALPSVVGFVTGIVIPGIQQFIGILSRVWTDVQPFLTSLANWFLNDALPVVMNYVTNVAVPQFTFWIGVLADMWVAVQPTLQLLYDWFINNGLPFIITALGIVTDSVDFYVATLAGLWVIVQPVLSSLFDWFTSTGMPIIQTWIQNSVNAVTLLINIISGIWGAVQTPLDNFKNGIMNAAQEIRDNAIQPLIDMIGGIGTAISDAWNDIVQFGADVGNWFNNMDWNPWDGTTQMGGGGVRAASRDLGGSGIAGNPYLIGRGAQPELFVPRSNGTFIPNADRALAGNSTTNHISVSVPETSILTPEAARTNGQIFAQSIEDEMIRKGL